MWETLRIPISPVLSKELDEDSSLEIRVSNSVVFPTVLARLCLASSWKLAAESVNPWVRFDFAHVGKGFLPVGFTFFGGDFLMASEGMLLAAVGGTRGVATGPS